MRFNDVIAKKKAGLALSEAEINFWIDGIMDETIPDYQTSALLMAICFQGMNVEETSHLTMAMLNSGSVIDLSAIEGVKVDKHSTGGVGDKTTVVLGPLSAACGAKVAKMSGRGLGHTGGTLDKLESIPGYNFALSKEEFINQVNDIGLALIGQTDETVPADKTIYALRDVTATVDSLPLIAASIMSKKLASGADTILLDVKYGDGAFMETKEDAEELAHMMINIGKTLDKNVRAMITNMNEPLGYAIGNSLEIIEAIDSIKGVGPKDLEELCVRSSAIMLVQANLYEDEEAATKAIYASMKDGSALNKLRELISAQGGNADVVDNYELLPQAKQVTEFVSKESGTIKKVVANKLGVLAMRLGAGRSKADEAINHAVGIVINHKVGDEVVEGDVIATVHHDQPLESAWIDELYESFEITHQEVKKEPIIYKVL